jgi:hypothetical protein
MIEIYAKDRINKEIEKTSWEYFIERCSTTFYYSLDRYYKKENLIFGLKFGKIKEFPINILKSLRLTLDDFEGDIVNYDTGIQWTDGIHPDLLFPEDHPEKAEKIKEANLLSHDLTKFTKNFCITEYQRIINYIHHNKFVTEFVPGPPFESNVEFI